MYSWSSCYVIFAVQAHRCLLYCTFPGWLWVSACPGYQQVVSNALLLSLADEEVAPDLTLDNVLLQLTKHGFPASKWGELATHLHQETNDPSPQLADVIERWLASNDESRSWRGLVDAVVRCKEMNVAKPLAHEVKVPFPGERRRQDMCSGTMAAYPQGLTVSGLHPNPPLNPLVVIMMRACPQHSFMNHTVQVKTTVHPLTHCQYAH